MSDSIADGKPTGPISVEVEASELISDYEPLKIIEPFDQEQPDATLKAKKTVSFNPNDEKIRKFTAGEPIVDQKNPFKNGHLANGRGEKKTPPPVPTKRSTLSVRKTVTQQLREREREKEKEREKEREQQKNEANTRKKNAYKSQPGAADDFVTTEEVLKQSKYVKTYIKNPDPYFVYDPTVLARLKFEELQREIAGQIPKRKQTANKPHRLAKPPPPATEANNKPAFKKCSKPNYPELANLKIRTGAGDTTQADLFNPAEVTKNAKKFDACVKKLQISSDDDLDEIDGPLTKSESSDELNQEMSGSEHLGTFTNTISSEEFQAYLERKGLALMPKQEMLSPSPSASPTPSNRVYPRTATPEERRQQVAESLAALRKSNTKKLSVLQRLSHSLFATRRKTTPKEMMPQPRTVYGRKPSTETPTEMRRITLAAPSEPNPTLQRSAERQSLIPRRVSPEGQTLNRYNRAASMDRSQIKERNSLVGQRRSVASYQSNDQPVAASTPLRKQLKEESQNEWEKLRAIKEVTDRQLYHKVLQQQQQQQQQVQLQPAALHSEENIYEHLQPNQLVTNPNPVPYFVRGSVQRNTFSGISGRHRQVMILDGTPIAPAPAPAPAPVRCQSVLDDLTPSQQTRRGYESENETPVVLRRKDNPSSNSNSRRIGGLLTREEILEKVKEFCRKSISRTPVPVATKMQMQPIYERNVINCADISPVSYASVETHKRPASQLSARPQVPLRVQSLPQQQPQQRFPSTASPIYAYVNKRNSLLSNDSEQYLSSHQLRLAPSEYEYVLIETEEGGVQAAKLLQPQFIRAHGRATPVILDRGSQQQQASQIYWTPQHQRQQPNNNRMTLPMSPRYASERGYPIPAPRLNMQANGFILANGHQYQHQPYATVVPAPRKLIQQQQQPQRGQLAQRQMNNTSDWECSSEAGEIRRILEKREL